MNVMRLTIFLLVASCALVLLGLLYYWHVYELWQNWLVRQPS